MFEYRVRITNPTDRDANVQECTLTDPSSMPLPVMGIGGLDIPANATGVVDAHFLLHLKKGDAGELVGQRISCTGLDWHGNPPV